MGRFSRRMRRRAAHAIPEPTLHEIAPGVYDVALPVPRGMPPDEARALVEQFAAELRATYGAELGTIHVCTPGACVYRPD